MSDQQANRPDPADSGDMPEQEKDELEQELLEKLPEKTTKAQEWGQGYATAKAIATGGNPDAPTDSAEGGTEMSVPDGLTLGAEHGVNLKPEEGGVVQVFCSRCDELVGRIQIVSKGEADEKTDEARKQVHGELAVIASEHRASCPGKQSN